MRDSCELTLPTADTIRAAFRSESTPVVPWCPVNLVPDAADALCLWH